MRERWFPPVCILAMLGFGLAVWSRLPERVPIHWNLRGEADGDASRAVAVLAMPALATLLWLLFLVLPRIDPHREAYPRFRRTYQFFINIVMLFLAGAQVAVLGNALDWDVSMPRVALVGGGLLIALVGNELTRVPPNWFVGIRTPWTLSDPEVWRRTHRLGARVLVVTGLVSALAGLFLPVMAATIVLLGGLLGAAVLLTVYSYLIWHQRGPLPER